MVVIVNLRLNCLPGVLSWDLGLSNIFGCCLVNSCGGLRKGEPVQSWVHLGKSTMPGCEKGCQIGSSEQQVHLQPFVLHLEFRVHIWLCIPVSSLHSQLIGKLLGSSNPY